MNSTITESFQNDIINNNLQQAQKDWRVSEWFLNWKKLAYHNGGDDLGAKEGDWFFDKKERYTFIRYEKK